jgi:hypothetical protein
MIDDHVGCFNVHRVLLQPLVQVSVCFAADFEQQTFDVIQFVIVSRLIVDVVA